jgi:hypothetical protein
MLIHGQQSSTLHGVLKGIVTDGWHSGAEVQVEFQGSPCGKVAECVSTARSASCAEGRRLAQNHISSKIRGNVACCM